MNRILKFVAREWGWLGVWFLALCWAVAIGYGIWRDNT